MPPASPAGSTAHQTEAMIGKRLKPKILIPLLCLSLFTGCAQWNWNNFVNNWQAQQNPARQGRQPAHRAYASAPVHRLSRICKVSYERQYGWSTEVLAEVQFVTGSQLNQATGSFSYNTFSIYSLIWFDAGEVAILKCKETVFGVGSEFSNADFRNLFLLRETADFEQVNSDHARKWRIRALEYLSFIDHRADD